MAGGEGEGVHCLSTGRCRADDTVYITSARVGSRACCCYVAVY